MDSIISNNSELSVLEGNDNQLTTVNTLKNTKLHRFNCRRNHIESLDLRQNIVY